MPHRRLVLASASPARKRLLVEAGIGVDVVISGVDEEVVSGLSCRGAVAELAGLKAAAVAATVPGSLVVGCDSMLDFEGACLGKPGSVPEVEERWRRLRGRSGTLLTGHCVIDAASGARADAVGSTLVRFGNPTDAEIKAYATSGEPLNVAGAFTLDGRSAPFIDGIEGDAGNVIGLSLPLLRSLLAELGVAITDLWL